MTTPPANDGVFLDVPDSTYHSWDLCSSTRLKTLDAQTPRHLRHQIDNPEVWDSSAKQLGRAVHSLVLEPHKWSTRFAQAPECDRRTKEGKQIWSDFCQMNEGREIVKADVGYQAQEMAESVLSNPIAAALLAHTPVREMSLIAPVFGARVKSRIDAYGELPNGDALLVDLKVTSHGGSRASFERAIANYGYGLQAATYCRVADACKLKVSGFCFIVVETEAPYCCAVYRLREDVISLFDQKLPSLIKTYTGCVASRKWPGYPDEVQEIGIPRWFQSQLENGEAA